MPNFKSISSLWEYIQSMGHYRRCTFPLIYKVPSVVFLKMTLCGTCAPSLIVIGASCTQPYCGFMLYDSVTGLPLEGSYTTFKNLLTTPSVIKKKKIPGTYLSCCCHSNAARAPVSPADPSVMMSLMSIISCMFGTWLLRPVIVSLSYEPWMGRLCWGNNGDTRAGIAAVGEVSTS